MKITFAIQENFNKVLNQLNGKEETPYYSSLEAPHLTNGGLSAEWSLYETDPAEWDEAGCNWPAYVTKSDMTLFIETATSGAVYIIRPTDGQFGGSGTCTVTYNGPYRGLLEQYLLPKMTPIFYMLTPVLHSGGVSTLLEYWEAREAAKQEGEVTHPHCLREGLKYEIPPRFDVEEFDRSAFSFDDVLLWALREEQVEQTKQGESLTRRRETFSVTKTEDDMFFYFTSSVGGGYILQRSTMKLWFYGHAVEKCFTNQKYRWARECPILDICLGDDEA